jgi:hypothetical protein
VAFGESVERLARPKFLGDLPFELDAMGTVLGHGFHPLGARPSRRRSKSTDRALRTESAVMKPDAGAGRNRVACVRAKAVCTAEMCGSLTSKPPLKNQLTTTPTIQPLYSGKMPVK